MKLIVGLGNPGDKYKSTRHNIGWKVIDAFIHRHNIELKKAKYTGIYYKGDDVIIAKPMTFMNSSGGFVQPMAKFYKIAPEDILVIYDDMDMASGHAKMKRSGSAGGQNGMKDIILKVGTQDIPRMKVGIGRPKNGAINHVIGKFTNMQLEQLNAIKDNLVDAIETFIDEGFEKAAMNLNSIK